MQGLSGLGIGSALKAAAPDATKSLLTNFASGAGQQAASSLGGSQDTPQFGPLPTPPQAQSFQIQPIVSSGSSAAPLNFSGGVATPTNNMSPQLLRLIQMLSAGGGG